MWNIKTRVIPVIIGATGTISKSFRKYFSDIPGNHDVKEDRDANGNIVIIYLGKAFPLCYNVINKVIINQL